MNFGEAIERLENQLKRLKTLSQMIEMPLTVKQEVDILDILECQDKVTTKLEKQA